MKQSRRDETACSPVRECRVGLSVVIDLFPACAGTLPSTAYRCMALPVPLTLFEM
jgi:hypothetical protein